MGMKAAPTSRAKAPTYPTRPIDDPYTQGTDPSDREEQTSPEMLLSATRTGVTCPARKCQWKSASSLETTAWFGCWEGGFGEGIRREPAYPTQSRRQGSAHRAGAGCGAGPQVSNEARAASAIQHPTSSMSSTPVGTADGAPYILMEFLEGVSLQKRLADRGRLSIPEVLDVAKQAGSALSAAHAVGIVHRDLKPENLFLVPDKTTAGGERVKVLDFGIAKMKHGSSSGERSRRRLGHHGQSRATCPPSSARTARTWTCARTSIPSRPSSTKCWLGEPRSCGDRNRDAGHAPDCPPPPLHALARRSRPAWRRLSCAAWHGRGMTASKAWRRSWKGFREALPAAQSLKASPRPTRRCLGGNSRGTHGEDLCASRSEQHFPAPPVRYWQRTRTRSSRPRVPGDGSLHHRRRGGRGGRAASPCPW